MSLLNLILRIILFLAMLVLPACSRLPEPSPAETGAPSPLKISVASPGMVRIPLEALGAVWKRTFDQPGNLSLTYRGAPVPLWVDAPGDALIFYAQGSDSLYTLDSIYILSAGKSFAAESRPPSSAPNPAMPELPAQLPAGGYYAFQQEESNLFYLPQADQADHWYWRALSAPVSQDFEIQTSDLLNDDVESPSGAQLTIALWSATESPTSPDHHLRVLVNGQTVAEEQWDGKGAHRIVAEFDPALLRSGANQVTLDASGDTGATVDQNYLDWLELRYPRRLRAEGDKLDFWSQGGALRLEGFSGAAVVYDITDPLKVERIQVTTPGKGEVEIETQAGRRYLAVGPNGYQKATSMQPLVTQSDLRAEGTGADYVAVAPADLLDPLQPLLDYRAGEGFQVMAVPLEAVYDQFNGGFPEPEAIQRFMKYAVQHWQPAPRFLLLVGDATYDPKGYLSPPEANRLPTFLVGTTFGGETASDVGFVQIDSDDLPDLAVGRLPARTSQQVITIVEKTLAYERALDASTQRRSILAVADGQEPSFKNDAEAWLELFPETVQTELLAPPPGPGDTADQIRNLMSQGEWLVAYFGHGSLTMWGKDQLFTAEDAAGLENSSKLPVVLNMTCLTGFFIHPKVESLTEALLFNPTGGAAAVLAPSSLTLAYDQSFLSQPLVAEVLAHPDDRLGEVHLAARRGVALDTPGRRDVMLTFMLFGDPALRLSSSAQ